MKTQIKTRIPKNTKVEQVEVNGDLLVITISNQNLLHLSMSEKGNLLIKAGRDVIGVVSQFGECYILNDKQKSKAYEGWLESDMAYDTSEIEFIGSMYKIKDHILCKNGLIDNGIFDFELGLFCQDCNDNNIRRYRNLTPVSC